MLTSYRTQRPTSLNFLLPTFSFRHSHTVWINSGNPTRELKLARDIPLGRSRIIATLFKLRGFPGPVQGSRAFICTMSWTDLASDVPSESIVGHGRSDVKLKVNNANDFVPVRSPLQIAIRQHGRRIISRGWGSN